MRGDRERLRDILDAIGKIEKYARRGRQEFDGDELLQAWMILNIQAIGEAARSLSADLRRSHPEIPWPQIIAMRNILVHEYFAADLQEVWRTVESDLPDLKSKVEAILSGLGGASPEEAREP